MPKRMTSPPRRLLGDELWAMVEPLIPPPPAARGPGGRPRVPDRSVLEGILFVLTTGCRWRDLPPELGCGSGVTCWRRLRDWENAAVWSRLHRLVLDRLGQDWLIDWSRHCLDGVSVRAKKGGELVGPNPVDRGKPGSKYHLLVDAAGVPLAAQLSAANTHDSLLFEPLLDAAPSIKGRGRGRPRRRPHKLHADKGYDNQRCRRYLRRRGITARIARGGIESKERLGRYRWVVERTVSWILRYKRLGLRYDRSELTMTALMNLACAYTCFKIAVRCEVL